MANFVFNKVILGGRIVSEPELKTTASGTPVVTVKIAVNRKSKDQQKADFFRVTAWRAQAEVLAKFFKKGTSICVVGQVQNNDYTDKDGNKRYITEVIADEVIFVDSRSEVETAEMPTGTQSVPPIQKIGEQAPNFTAVTDDGDLPF